MNIYRKFDAWLLNTINEGYLWLYDWTGVYVGSIIFIDVILGAMAAIQRGHMWVAAIVFLCAVLMGMMRYNLQARSAEAYNKVILAGENFSFPIRTFFVFFNLISLIADIIVARGIMDCIADISYIAMWYLLDIKIRDRIKKDFKLPKLAHGRI